jgi:hypothetical protein
VQPLAEEVAPSGGSRARSTPLRDRGVPDARHEVVEHVGEEGGRELETIRGQIRRLSERLGVAAET